MAQDDFDVIVVGAGLAGLCCAGELVLSRAKTLLICETREVGQAIKPHDLDGNTAVIQAPTHMVGWGGGWWATLARKLNANIYAPNGFNSLGYNLAVEGTGRVQPLVQGAMSASSLNAALAQLAGEIDPALQSAFNSDCERVLHSALAIPYKELAKMDGVPMGEWLDSQRADELVSNALFMIGAGMYGSTMDFMRSEASVYGIVAMLRVLLCGEATLGWIYPDNQTGMAIPLAEAIEGHGGTVWRGKKVASIVFDGDTARGVTLDGGSEVRASMIALSGANTRTEKLLTNPPEEVEAAIAYSRDVTPHYNFHLLSLLDEPVLPASFKSWVGVLSKEGSLLGWMTPSHAVSSWGVKPGKQMVESGITIPAADAEAEGRDAIFDRLDTMTESFFPGFQAAKSAEKRYSPNRPGNLWFGPLCAGPKMPRTSESIPALWFVGEGSTPTCGVYMEGAASAGILGARQMIAVRNGTTFEA